MVRVEAIKDFTLRKYNEIKNLKSRTIKKEGKLYRLDQFECSEELAKYLLGANESGIVAVRILEVIPNGDLV